MPDSSKVKAEAVRHIGTTWSEIHIFTEKECELTLPEHLAPLGDEERAIMAKLFSSREYAFRAGITLSGTDFAVHQYETTRGVQLAYGRAGNAVSGSGACVAKMISTSAPPLYVAISYKFPSLSAGAVSRLIDFANEFLSPR